MDVDYVQQLEQQNEQLVKKLGWLESRYEDALSLRAKRRYRMCFGCKDYSRMFDHTTETSIYASTVETVKYAIKQEIIEVLSGSIADASYFDIITIECVYHHDMTFNAWTMELYKKDKWYYSAFRCFTSGKCKSIDGVPVDWLNEVLVKIAENRHVSPN